MQRSLPIVTFAVLKMLPHLTPTTSIFSVVAFAALKGIIVLIEEPNHDFLHFYDLSLNYWSTQLRALLLVKQ